MTTKFELNEKLEHQFEQQMVDAQDLMRGIPESHLTAFEASRRHVDEALLESNPSIEKALSNFKSAQIDSFEAIEAKAAQAHLETPLSEALADSLVVSAVNQQCDSCCMRDFELPFYAGLEFNFGTESPVNDVEQGLVGWGDHSDPPPTLVNTGSGNGQIMNGALTLHWGTVVPHDGIFAVRPNQERSSYPVYGKHKVRGRGWALSSNDARVEVHSWVVVFLDDQWIHNKHTLVSWDATKSENRTKYFGAWIDLPGRITFQAQEGQSLAMWVKLVGLTWANDEGLAELEISSFGLPSNGVADMHLHVLD